MKNLFILCVVCCLAVPVTAQQTNVWNTLGMMKFERQYAEGDIGSQAGSGGRFRTLIENMDGDEIEVKGYVIPLSGKKAQSNFMFSAYPYNMCFFCGKAGPESVMEVFMKDNKTVNFSEKPIKIVGTFRFYPNDPNEIMYKLENARLAN